MTDNEIKSGGHAVENSGESIVPVPDEQFDAASSSLSEALSISFKVLKAIMIVLLVLFLASGFRTVAPDEQALVLRFGKIRGLGEERIRKPGLHWILPYPIEEIVKISVAKKVNLAVDSFWFFQKAGELVGDSPTDRTRVPRQLDPERDGYSITRSSVTTAGELFGSDYNIVHCKWQLIYRIGDPEQFFTNVYVGDPRPGQVYFELVTESLKPLLKAVVDDAVVTTMVHYTIDEAIVSAAAIPVNVRRRVQATLDSMESGIVAEAVHIVDVTWPRQVSAAFQASIKADQEAQRLVSEARSYYDNSLHEAGGLVAESLLAVLKGPNSATKDGELLWQQVAGDARGIIARARGYRTEVVESARANAGYLEEILPLYHRHPRLVVQGIYRQAVESILRNADEKMILQPAKSAAGREIRVMLNRDPVAESNRAGQIGK